MTVRSRVRLCAVAVLVAATALVSPPSAPRSHAGGVELANAAPFRVKDLEGHVLELDALRKRGPVLLDFWATWCKPCHAAIPELEAWRAKYQGQGLTIIGVSVDGPRNHAKVRPFVSRMNLRYPVVIDEDGRLQQLYQVVALPTTVLIDTSGTIVTARVGFRPGESQSLGEKIVTLLPSPSPAEAPPSPPPSSSTDSSSTKP